MAEYAVALNFDSRGTTRLLGLMCGNYMFENNIRPHLTLGVFKCADEREAVNAFYASAARVERFRISFTAVGAFHGGCIFCSPAASKPLHDSYRQVYNSFLDRDLMPGADGLYTPLKWIPHAAVSYNLVSDFSDCFVYVRRMFRPFECDVTEITLVRLEPYTEIYSVEL
ncbi:MAG: 2'-5' RNA ligase family protein [Ruminococcus sp.]|nr:2'-5' RNA ligase family protein [Ruminococcus sp.]